MATPASQSILKLSSRVISQSWRRSRKNAELRQWLYLDGAAGKFSHLKKPLKTGGVCVQYSRLWAQSPRRLEQQRASPHTYQKPSVNGLVTWQSVLNRWLNSSGKRQFERFVAESFPASSTATSSSLDRRGLRTRAFLAILLVNDWYRIATVSNAVTAGAFHCDIALTGCIAWHSVAKFGAVQTTQAFASV
jgi:hypothetical protein